MLLNILKPSELARQLFTHRLAGCLRPSALTGIAALVGGLFVGIVTLWSLPRLGWRILRALRSAPQVGPLMRLLLAPLFLGSLMLLPLVALVAGAVDGGCHAGGGLPGRWLAFARVAPGQALELVVTALQPGGPLALPV